VSLFALSRLGYSLLLLSNRLSTEAYINLLTQTKCSRIIIAPSFQKSFSTIQSESIMSLQSFWLIERSQYELATPSGPYFTRRFNGPRASNSIVFIIHSSGSTGLPKPIFQTQKAALTNYASGLPYKALLTLPLYHNHGLSCLFRAIYAGNEIALFNANLPLTGANLIATLEKLQPGGFHGVPYALKLLAESERGIQLLSTCDVVQFGGSSCPDETGDRLVEGGVHLISHYGA
jgi:acyl-CoA synthetase (AMP-forming)/AMP-acid ligase II